LGNRNPVLFDTIIFTGGNLIGRNRPVVCSEFLCTDF
jgi:hypothetical protein